MSKTFETALTAIFEAVEPEFRKRTVEHYRDIAKQQHSGWLNRLKEPEPVRSMLYFEITSPPKYSVIKAKDSRTPAYAGTWAQKQQANWQCDLNAAEKDANRSVDQAKEHFVSKMTAKLTNATKLRKDKPTLTGKLQFNGIVVEGDLYVEYKCGDYFRMTMQIITNYRHGHSYYQFPARFKDVGFGPKPARLIPHGPYSEAWLAKNFSKKV
jgi:hypothetical protein